MKSICITSLTWLLVALAGCTDRDKESILPEQAGAGAEVTFSYAASKAAGGMTPRVLVFRRQAGVFLYEQTVADGWTASAENTFTRSVQLPAGAYKFLFAAGYGTRTQLSPEPAAGLTGFDDVSFQNTLEGDNILPADELFMPFPVAQAARVYQLDDPTTVSCTLRRAVSRVVLYLKRGHSENGSFTPEPYPDSSDDITRHIRQIDLTLGGVAQGVSPAGSQGRGNTSVSLSLEGVAPDKDGFAILPGPFFIPLDGQPLGEATFTFHLQPGNTLAELTRTVDLGHLTVLPDQQLEITLWFNSFGAPESPIDIRVDVNTAFFEQDGDQGTWN